MYGSDRQSSRNPYAPLPVDEDFQDGDPGRTAHGQQQRRRRRMSGGGGGRYARTVQEQLQYGVLPQRVTQSMGALGTARVGYRDAVRSLGIRDRTFTKFIS